MSGQSLDRGRRIAELLAGAWRATPPRLMLPLDQLSDLVPALIRAAPED